MADLKRHMFRHLRSAKVWLTRAEESFDKDSNIRGELDLFLAQAELQHAREANHSQNGSLKNPVLRHAASFMLAVSIACVAFGFVWWSNSHKVANPIPLAVQDTKILQTAPTSQEIAAVPPIVQGSAEKSSVQVSQPPSQIHSQQVDKSQRVASTRQTEKDNLVPPDEMQKIIRAAGKSLRGQ